MAPKNTTPAATEATTPAATDTTAAQAPATTEQKFKMLAPISGIVMPAKKTAGRKSESKFPFEKLEVGQSFGLVGRTQKSMSSIVSSVNRNEKNMRPVLDANGNPTFKMTEAKQPDGTIVKIATAEKVMERIKEFAVFDMDPATDPEGATCRVSAPSDTTAPQREPRASGVFLYSNRIT